MIIYNITWQNDSKHVVGKDPSAISYTIFDNLMVSKIEDYGSRKKKSIFTLKDSHLKKITKAITTPEQMPNVLDGSHYDIAIYKNDAIDKVIYCICSSEMYKVISKILSKYD